MALSYLNETSGGALVRPSKRKLIQPRVKRLVWVKSGPCVRNQTGNRYHDSETGHPCSPDKPSGGGSSSSKPHTSTTPPKATSKPHWSKQPDLSSSESVYNESAEIRRQRRVESGQSKKKWRGRNQAVKSAIRTVWGTLTNNIFTNNVVTRVGVTAAKAVGKLTAEVGKEVWNDTPEPVKKTALVCTAVGSAIGSVLMKAEHGLEGIGPTSQKLVEKVARARGLDKLQAKKVRRTCAIIDTVARWTTNIPIVHAGLEHIVEALELPDVEIAQLPVNTPVVGALKTTGAFGMAKIGYYIPVASLGYLGYSTAKNPIKTAKAAWDFFRKKSDDGHGHGHHDGESTYSKIKRILLAKRGDHHFGDQTTQEQEQGTEQLGKLPSYEDYSPKGLYKSVEVGEEELTPSMDKLVETYQQYGFTGDPERDSWFETVLMTALDVSSDLFKALEITKLILEENPTTPDIPDSPEIFDWLPDVGGGMNIPTVKPSSIKSMVYGYKNSDHWTEAKRINLYLSKGIGTDKPIGVPFQGPSGKWFVKNPKGKVVPAKNPNATATTTKKPTAKPKVTTPAPAPKKPTKVKPTAPAKSTPESVKAGIEDLKAGVTQEKIDKVTLDMSNLSGPELNALKKELVIKAGGKKAEMAKKIVDQLVAKISATPIFTPTPAPSTGASTKPKSPKVKAPKPAPVPKPPKVAKEDVDSINDFVEDFKKKPYGGPATYDSSAQKKYQDDIAKEIEPKLTGLTIAQLKEVITNNGGHYNYWLKKGDLIKNIAGQLAGKIYMAQKFSSSGSASYSNSSGSTPATVSHHHGTAGTTASISIPSKPVPKMNKPPSGSPDSPAWKAACEDAVLEVLNKDGKSAADVSLMNHAEKYKLLNSIVSKWTGHLNGMDIHDVNYSLANLETKQASVLLPPKFAKGGAENKPNPKLPNESRPKLDLKEAVAVQKYTGTAYSPLNNALRGTAPLTGYIKELHDDLSEAFKKAKPFKPPVTVHRGMKFNSPADAEKVLSLYRQAQSSDGILRMPGYTSTATNPVSHFSAAMSSGVSINMKIAAVEGLDLLPYTHYPHESELLLNHNAGVRVKSMTQNGNVWEIELEQVPEEDISKHIPNPSAKPASTSPKPTGGGAAPSGYKKPSVASSHGGAAPSGYKKPPAPAPAPVVGPAPAVGPGDPIVLEDEDETTPTSPPPKPTGGFWSSLFGF